MIANWLRQRELRGMYTTAAEHGAADELVRMT